MQADPPFVWKTLPNPSNMMADIYMFNVAQPAASSPSTPMRGTRVTIAKGRITCIEKDIALPRHRPPSSSTSSSMWTFRTTPAPAKTLLVRSVTAKAKEKKTPKNKRQREAGGNNAETDEHAQERKAKHRDLMRSRRCQFCCAYAPIHCANANCCKKCCHAKSLREEHVVCGYHANKTQDHNSNK